MRSLVLTAAMAVVALPVAVSPGVAQEISADLVQLSIAKEQLATAVAELRGRLPVLAAAPRTRLPQQAPRSPLPPLPPPGDADPADSLYRAARSALNQREYAKAAQLFARVATVKGSRHAANAGYWRAFALYRLGGRANLEAAAATLDEQTSRYPEATTSRDAMALATRVQAALARAGSASAAAAIALEASAAADAADMPAAAAPPAYPRAIGSGPPMPPRAPRPPRGVGPARAGAMPGDGCGGDDEDDVRLAALNGLLQMDADRATPILQKVLARRDAGSVCLRRKAVFLVAQQQTSETERILLDAVRADPDAEVRSQAVFWLSQVNSPQATAALDSILNRSTDDEVRDKAIFALSQQNSAAATEALRRFVRKTDAPMELRGQALFWLGQRGAMDLATMKELYATLDDDDLKEKLIFSVSQGGKDGGPFLLEVAKNPKESVQTRKQALFWLGQTKGVSITELVGLYNATTDAEMRDQLIFVYSQRRESQALDKLIEIAKKDRDPELRKKALFWVGQSRDPRAAQLLGEILDQ